jgi:tetratricopeptide (TPR) repeat protein
MLNHRSTIGITLLLISYIAINNRVLSASTGVDPRGQWHEPVVGESFEGENAAWNTADLVTVLCRDDRTFRNFALYGVHLPMRGAYPHPMLAPICEILWRYGQCPHACEIPGPPMGPILAMGNHKHPFKVIVRKKIFFQPPEVEIITADGESINERLRLAGPLHNDAEVTEALVFPRYSSEASRKLVASSYLAEAISSAHAKNWQKALSMAKRAIKADPAMAEAYHVAGLAEGQLYGLQSDESRFYYSKFVHLEPDMTKKVFLKDIFPDMLK